MPRRLSISYIKKEFKKEGYKLLTTEYVDSTQKLDYICPKGHTHSITWNNWQQGHRCMYCCCNKNRSKITIKFIRKEFKKENYKLLTTKYENVHQKLDYVCPKGHTHLVSWNNWKHLNSRCPYCFHESRMNLDITDEEREVRRRYPDYYQWRKAVFGRDDNTCQVCGSTEKSVAHHLESYTNNRELRTVLSNGITLCKKCHINFHHCYGNRDNTKEQFIAFINE